MEHLDANVAPADAQSADLNAAGMVILETINTVDEVWQWGVECALEFVNAPLPWMAGAE